LINGKGRYSGGPTDVDLAVVNVTAGKRSATFAFNTPFLLARTELRSISYRFRLVSISCDPNFTFSVDGHNMTIIEVDGNNVEPLVVDSIQIFAGKLLPNSFPISHLYR
jgi:iron transport multicopper oxidase